MHWAHRTAWPTPDLTGKNPTFLGLTADGGYAEYCTVLLHPSALPGDALADSGVPRSPRADAQQRACDAVTARLGILPLLPSWKVDETAFVPVPSGWSAIEAAPVMSTYGTVNSLHTPSARCSDGAMVNGSCIAGVAWRYHSWRSKSGRDGADHRRIGRSRHGSRADLQATRLPCDRGHLLRHEASQAARAWR